MNPQQSSYNPTDHGWEKGKDGELYPVTVPKSVPLAPEELLKLIKCNCKKYLPCSTQRCGCRSTGIVCTVFCACQGENCWISIGPNTEDDSDRLTALFKTY